MKRDVVSFYLREIKFTRFNLVIHLHFVEGEGPAQLIREVGMTLQWTFSQPPLML